MIRLFANRYLLFVPLMLSLLLFCCAGGSERRYSFGGQIQPPSSYADKIEGAAGMADSPSDPDEDRRDSEAGEKVDSSPRMVIYSADYRIQVESVKQTVDRVNDMTRRLGGFIESMNTSDSYRAARITARVPVLKFNDALDETDKLGRVDHKSVSASDVTMRFTDVSLRVDTARKVRDRLYELLRRVEKSSEKVEILREIARITTSIDNMTAEMEHLKSRASFSTITLDIRAIVRDISRRYIASPFRWIALLNPRTRSIVHGRDGDLDYSAPSGFFNMEKDFFKSGSPVRYLFTKPDDSAGMRLGIVDNYPKADRKFWNDALKIDFNNRMYDIKSADTVTAGSGLEFDRYAIGLAGGDVYVVAFAVKDKKIIVFESLFRNDKVYSESGDAMNKLLKSLGYD